MRKWFQQLDALLRGDATRPSALKTGTIEISASGISIVIILLGFVYGMCMGTFALFKQDGPTWLQFLASTIKVPALFLLTLLVTLPSLYVFNALVGSRLNLPSLWRLLIASLAVNLTVLASLGPIVAFFSASTKSYSFMVLLNVVMFAVAGVLGLVFLRQTLHRLSLLLDQTKPPPPIDPSPPPVPSPIPGHGALDQLDGHILGPHVKSVFRVWMIVFAVVGAQMGWVLRPFLGNPAQPFSWFRPRESNFFEGLWKNLLDLFS